VAIQIVAATVSRLADRHRGLASSGESGQAMVEYAFLLGLIAAVVAFGLTPIGTAVSNLIAPVLEGF
jgi:hypothetical protein